MTYAEQQRWIKTFLQSSYLELLTNGVLQSTSMSIVNYLKKFSIV